MPPTQWKLPLASGDVWMLKKDSLLPYEASVDDLFPYLRSRRVRAVRPVVNEDVKTAVVKRDGKVPAETEGRLLGALQNFYGIYLRVHFDGADRAIYVKASDMAVVADTTGIEPVQP